MISPTPDGARRFVGRAESYAAGRPGYPTEFLRWLRASGAMAPVVADIGAGTGISTRLLLHSGAQVLAVEPNDEMRAELTAAHDGDVASGRLVVTAGTAEHTRLSDGAAGLALAAQSAHWFEPVATARELRRILEPGGRVVLVWNDWRGSPEPFCRDYAEIVAAFRGSGSGDPVGHPPLGTLPPLLAPEPQTAVFPNPVALDRARLRDLAASASYLPGPDDPASVEVARRLDAVFDAHACGGTVTMTYRTYAFLGVPRRV